MTPLGKYFQFCFGTLLLCLLLPGPLSAKSCGPKPEISNTGLAYATWMECRQAQQIFEKRDDAPVNKAAKANGQTKSESLCAEAYEDFSDSGCDVQECSADCKVVADMLKKLKCKAATTLKCVPQAKAPGK